MSAEPRPSEPVLCDNYDGHDGEDVPAIWRVTFPDSHWNPCTACWECFDLIMDNLRDEPTAVLFTPAGSDPQRQS